MVVREGWLVVREGWLEVREGGWSRGRVAVVREGWLVVWGRSRGWGALASSVHRARGAHACAAQGVAL